MFRRLNLDLLLILLIFLTAPLFFYKLGQSSLVSFDEAWYGDIARNIIKNKDLINLKFNGNAYLDHPPAGFWLIAASENFFGANEFGVRFAPSLSGLFCMLILYLLGNKLFSRSVGFAAALSLPSAFWFLFRARSGNLDVILTFFFLLTIYFSILASKEKKFLLPWSIALSYLILTKTLIPFTILPALLIIFWKSSYKLKDFKLPLIVFAILGGWFMYNVFTNQQFFSHFFKIGLPGVSVETNYIDNFKLINEYLHSGVGKWFWPGIASLLFGLFLMQKRFLILSIFFLSFFIPFIFSQKGHIWHLIPIFPIMILSSFGVAYFFLKKILKNEIVIFILFMAIVSYVWYLQVRRSYYEFIDVPAFVSDEAILSKEASKYPWDYYIDGDFVPAAIFYSEKIVKQISTDELQGLFERQEPILLITYKWRLDQFKIKNEQYEVLKTDRDKMLILIK